MTLRTVKRRNGKSVRIPVDEDGYVPYDELLRHHEERSPRARAMDSRRVSKVVRSPLITPEDAASWWVNPGRSDIYGVDARRPMDPPRPDWRAKYRIAQRPPEAPELIPLQLGGFHFYGEWYDALGDAVFVERDPWRNYWYLADIMLGDCHGRVYFKIPSKYFNGPRSPKFAEDFAWGQFVDQFEWLPCERWENRPKGYALNYSVRRGKVRGRRRFRIRLFNRSWRTIGHHTSHIANRGLRTPFLGGHIHAVKESQN